MRLMILSLVFVHAIAHGASPAPVESSPGGWASMAEGAYSLMNGKCAAVDQAEALRATREVCAKLGGAGPTSQISEVAQNLNADAMGGYFEALARQHARELGCAADFAKALSSDDAGLARVAATLKVVRATRKAWTDAVKQNQTAGRGDAQACPSTTEELDTSAYGNVERNQRCATLIKARVAYRMAIETIPLAGESEVTAFTKNYGERTDDPDDQALTEQLKTLYAGATAKLTQQRIGLEARAKYAHLDGFSPSERRSLIADPTVVDRIASSNPGALRPLACLADARYGRGADARDSIFGVTSLALGVGASIKVGSLAIQAARTAYTLRAANLLSQVGFRTLRFGASAGLVGHQMQEVQRGCFTHVLKTQASAAPTCVSAPSLKELDQNTCALSLGLTMLAITSLPIKDALVDLATKTDRLRALNHRKIEWVLSHRTMYPAGSGSTVIESLPEKLRDLGKAAATTANSVVVDGDKRVIKVSYLAYTAEQAEFMAKARKAVRAGLIDEIQAGQVAGPKVLPLLLRLRQEAPAGHPIIITGYLNPKLMKTYAREERIDNTASFVKSIERDLKSRGIDQTNPLYGPVTRTLRNHHLAPEEYRRFEDAYEKLGLDRAMKKLKASNEDIYFKMDTSRPLDAISWSRYDPFE